MFGNHVKKELSAYAHGELDGERAERVARHLGRCLSCRDEFEQINLGIRLAEQLPPAAAPDSLWEGIEASLIRQRAGERHSGRSRERPASSVWSRLSPSRLSLPAGRGRLAAASLALVLLFGAGAFVLYRRATRPAWEVTSVEGAPVVGSTLVGKAGKLAVGAWLETDANSRARVQVADIGQVEVEPGTRLRLVETRLTEHRLELQRGRINARIWAPPRLFYVDTPSAVAEDLGCAYSLEVDDAGKGLLHVTHGWVALALNGRESMVPAGAACATQPGTGPGTPFFEDASEPLVEALARLDFGGGGADALRVVLAESRVRDTLTLWHLLPRVEGEDRARVYDRLTALASPPEGVTREGVLALDREMLDAWKERLDPIWVQESFPAVRRAWRKIWKLKQ